MFKLFSCPYCGQPLFKIKIPFLCEIEIKCSKCGKLVEFPAEALEKK